MFAPLLPWLDGIQVTCLELPRRGAQDHDSLAEALSGQLGDTPFVLLGESFSGPLAHRLALQAPSGLRGLILAASFLQCPSPLLALAKHLPLPRSLLGHPATLRLLCTGKIEPQHLQAISEEIQRLPSELLRARLRSLANLREPERTLQLPTLHLWPQADRLVSQAAAKGIARHCSDLRQERIDGPHFLLQSRPQACAQAIRRFMAELAVTSPALP
ncbi:alpha/beta fold hydrolase [Pseudomonas sp. BMS12]|uniref:alpha/beta fold hydrolase n=1 Tax=Pseudomonas sp. BMS12 TaxID=1796033 RepID=UPI001F2A7527|nr:alpha/beta hydrolase [Pseudomonas sp. BMS12]